jgi:hypothetical protein
VGEDGQPQRPRVTKGVHEALDARVLRAIETTTFATKPGTDLTGETVSVGLSTTNRGREVLRPDVIMTQALM